MPDFTKLLAIGLLNYADDHGYFWANPLMIRGSLFPFDEDSSKIRRALAQLAAEGFIRLGSAKDGREAGHVVNFKKHQRVDRAADSEIEPLVSFDERSSNVLRLFDDDSSQDRKGREGKGKDSILTADEPPVEAKARQPRPLFDALCVAEGSNPKEIGPKGGMVAKALKDIQTVSPDVTPQEIASRAANYRREWPTVTLTCTALAKHWARLGGAGNGHRLTEAERYAPGRPML